MIMRDSSFTEPHISDDGVRAILAPTLYAQYADLFLSLSRQYSIDPLWCLAYLKWENGFSMVGSNVHFSWHDNNPWDIICRYDENWTTPCAGLGVPNRWGADGCVGNGTANQAYCYAHYPTREIGLEAGFRNWRRYSDELGLRTYHQSLSVALCGIAGGCPGSNWPESVIATASAWSDQYPYTSSPCGGQIPCPNGACPPCITEGSVVVPILGAGMMFGAAYLLLRSRGLL